MFIGVGRGRFLLSSHELSIVDESILVVVVLIQDRVDHGRQLVVGEQLILWGRRVVAVSLKMHTNWLLR